MADQDLFYVGIQSPDQVRKTLLESMREVVGSLERFEKFKQIRKERVDNIEKFKTTQTWKPTGMK